MRFLRRMQFALVLLCMLAGAQASWAQAVYTLYPAPVGQKEKADSMAAAPKGYSPVYVSHFGRHGSRYLIKRDERASYKVLSKAGMPQNVLEAVNNLRAVNLGHEGDLTDLGALEQQGIGERLAKRLPGLFGTERALSGTDQIRVRARSSIAGRCKESMQSFLEGMRHVSPQVKASTSSSIFTYRMFSKGVRHRSYKPADPRLLALAHYAWNAECFGGGKSQIIKYFSPEEQQSMQAELDSSFRRSLMPESRQEALCARPLLEDIVSRADAVLSGKRHYSADLRFGHDSAFVPLGRLMGLKGFDKSARIGDIVPMAANIQLVFYRSDAAPSDVIVQILHNEVATSIPELTPAITNDTGHYYSWPVLKAYFKTASNPHYPRNEAK